MTTKWLMVWVALISVAFPTVAWTAEAEARAAAKREFEVVDFQRRTIYHAPQTPGYTCWVYAWLMPDGSVMITFYQATGPLEGRPRAPDAVQKKLSWPHLSNPRRDMTGLNTCNVYLRSADGGATWSKVSADKFRSPMNGIVLGCTGLRDGTILRGISGACLAYDPDLPRTGLIQRSSDGTQTWSKPLALLSPEAYTAYPIGIRQLRDGRVMILGGVAPGPCDRPWGEYGKVMEPLLIVSRDGGKSWGPPITVIPEANRKGWACEECDAAELPNGDLFWVFRRCAPEDESHPLHQRRHVQWQGLMEKHGDTWTPKWAKPTPWGNTGLPNLLMTREGVVLYPKVGCWTDDAGEHWHRLNLPDMAYYPKAVQLPDGKILVFAHMGSDDPYGVDQKIVIDSFRLKAR